jgi:primosomal protein N' (replication factor Y)
MRYAKVVLGLPLEGPFLYLIPEKFRKYIGVGRRVIVPFKEQRAVGYIVGFSFTSKIKTKIKEIEELIDEEQLITGELLRLTRWIADYYFCAWGEAIEAAIPPILRKGKIKIKDVYRKKNLVENAGCTMDDVGRKIRLTNLQARALKPIEKSLTKEKREVFLIQNIREKDRLNIYFQAIEFNLKQGKSSIFLLPEISLVSPVENQLKSRFGKGTVSLIHSRLSPVRLYQEWKRIRNKESSIVIGTRSAIFAPVKNLKLIIIDEESDSSYKQIEVPRYNAKDVALKRAKFTQAVVILASMMPSVESYYNVKIKGHKLIAPTLYKKHVEVKLKVINMRREHYGRQKTKPLISNFLESKIKEVLSQKEKIILFLNRRGFATFIHCPNCKSILRCKNCHSSLKYHFKQRLVVCHYCGYKLSAPEICPKCNVAYVRYAGSGTQRLESELHRLFPYARTLRIDTDNVCRDISSRYKEVDILAGTQIINKMQFRPQPRLAGIISLDSLLNMPDFRGTERAFQLLIHFTNLVKKRGDIIIQTYFPEASILRFVEQRDYLKFYKEELNHRKGLNLPPFKHIILLTLRAKFENKLVNQAQRLASILIEKKPRGVDVVGPIPHPISKLRGKYQQNIIIKAKNVFSVNKFLRENLGGLTKSRIGNIPLTVDVDPL